VRCGLLNVGNSRSIGRNSRSTTSLIAPVPSSIARSLPTWACMRPYRIDASKRVRAGPGDRCADRLAGRNPRPAATADKCVQLVLELLPYTVSAFILVLRLRLLPVSPFLSL
jgi:hypothetical protein